ncbi:MAG TPA: PEP-CTERM sorting domain-containing protein [Candidatus Aquabacterium excrementipullorum]|nr:PEP-CTERM sorting domain-containing protein [Candidatus Aquabacterium excrementipullorum]
MFKRSILALATAVVAFNAHAVSSGDLAFTAFNADEDGWSLVTFVDLAANSQFYFTDNEWDGSSFNSGESYHAWNTGSSVIAAGTVIRFSSTDTTNLSASLGTLSRASVSGSTNYGISQDNDTVYLYQGASATAPTTFVAAISTGGFTADQGLLTNTGLSIGAGAVKLGAGSDYAEYTGDRSSLTSLADYKALVSDVANWTDRGNGAYAAVVPNTTAFTVTAVPEPDAAAMVVAGIGLLGFMGRRRLAR